MKLGMAITIASLSFSAFAGIEIKLNSGTINTRDTRIALNDSQTAQTEWVIQFKDRITEPLKKELKQQR